MKSNFLRWLVLAPFFVLASVDPSQAEHRDQGPSQVTLSLKEFEALFFSAKLKELEQKSKDQWQRHEKEHQQQLKRLELANQNPFPQNYQVLQHTASGVYNATTITATFDMEVTIRVMSPANSWTVVPLIANTTVASGWQIEILENNHTDFSQVDAVTSTDILLLRRKDYMEFATSRHGLFRVRFQAFSRVAKARNIHQLTMSQFLYAFSDFDLSVYGNVRDFSVEPVEAFWRVEPVHAEDGNVTASNIKVTLPLTADKIEIRWLDDGGAAEPKGKFAFSSEEGDDNSQEEPEESPQVTVIHEVMHSVDEGMVRSSHIVEYTSSGELSVPVDFALLAGPETRITSIESHALQSWEILKTTQEQQLIRLHWKRSHLDSTATVLLQAETDRAGAKEEQLELPSIVCQGVLRQVGHVGVTKDANVEVHEQLTQGGMARCEPSEISSKLRLNMDRPIILSYKYLNPSNASIVVNVHEHVAMEVLESSVDRLHYKAVVTKTHTMHSVLVVLQSTKLQYLELFSIPESASLFSLLVNSVPCKPIAGQNQSILVPLLVGLDPEAANSGTSLLTSVELSYISTLHKTLGPDGTIVLSPPHLELPISVLTTHVRLPTEYVYNFTGDFGKPDRDLAVPVPPSYSYQTGKRVIEKDYRFGFKDDVWPDDDVKPKETAVKIVTPNTGRSYFFHRLLVIGTKLSLNASISEPKVSYNRSWWSTLFGQSQRD